MSFRNTFGIYDAIKQELEASETPMTCVDLFDRPTIKIFSTRERPLDANRVSDYLGHMYRQGLLKRVAAPKTYNSAARYAY